MQPKLFIYHLFVFTQSLGHYEFPICKKYVFYTFSNSKAIFSIEICLKINITWSGDQFTVQDGNEAPLELFRFISSESNKNLPKIYEHYLFINVSIISTNSSYQSISDLF